MTKKNNKTSARQLTALAEKYRSKAPRSRLKDAGLVVIYKNAIVGWIKGITDPSQWKPGCFAVDKSGRIWKSVGGSQNEGAAQWEPQDERK